MRPIDLFKFALKALRERKLRAVLTIIGIVIGPATIVALVGATQGFSAASSSRFQDLGASTIFVTPVGRGFSLTTATTQEIAGLQDVAYVVPYQEASGQISQDGTTVNVDIYAANLAGLSHIFPSLSLQQGAVPSDSDIVGALVGHSIAYPDISGAVNLTVNQVLTATDVRTSASFVTFAVLGGAASGSFVGAPSASAGTDRSFVVRGILNTFGQGLFINPDDSIFIQPSAGQAMLHSSTYSGVVVVASSPSTVTTVTNELTAQFGNDIRATAVTSLTSTITSITQGISTLLEAVAGTSVIVAFVGILTTMLTSVLERTTEIGVLKSLGASSRSIMLSFITEASLTGVIGGVVGACSGAALSYVIISLLSGSLGLGRGALTGGSTAARGAGAAFGGGGFGAVASSATSTSLTITPVITPELIVIAILIAAAVGTLGGLLPAWRASRLTPVEALHRS